MNSGVFHLGEPGELDPRQVLTGPLRALRRVRLAAGESAVLDAPDAEFSLFVLSGDGTVTTGDAQVPLREGVSVTAPLHTRPRITAGAGLDYFLVELAVPDPAPVPGAGPVADEGATVEADRKSGPVSGRAVDEAAGSPTGPDSGRVRGREAGSVSDPEADTAFGHPSGSAGRVAGTHAARAAGGVVEPVSGRPAVRGSGGAPGLSADPDSGQVRGEGAGPVRGDGVGSVSGRVVGWAADRGAGPGGGGP
ncbi:hypothetical protein GCM10022243_14460 [Saccharothrix violaceirubra]|uniref:Quercetin dioxygenase-like cupin family protein n=1 Tax=Saccharothrix violaceirubra TaxID=413306 RepID=A0A7W7WXQ6_9PSEU|nr:hypothetical protein [Saccharothrix violaceirubra]MBB4967321.1 quercetin dioxygenase-like cupin family protein [Saccharothrix violaceirubra]